MADVLRSGQIQAELLAVLPDSVVEAHQATRGIAESVEKQFDEVLGSPVFGRLPALPESVQDTSSRLLALRRARTGLARVPHSCRRLPSAESRRGG